MRPLRWRVGNAWARLTYAAHVRKAEGSGSFRTLMTHRHVPGPCKQQGFLRYAFCMYCGAKLPC